MLSKMFEIGNSVIEDVFYILVNPNHGTRDENQLLL